MSTAAVWMGPAAHEARSALERAKSEKMPGFRALVVANIASFRDCWAFRKRIAAHVGCSVRTVQRAITQGFSLGLLGKARAKPGEKPPGSTKTFECGWSHRWTIGWGQAGEAVKKAVEAARARWVISKALMAPPKAPKQPVVKLMPAARPKTEHQRRGWTAEELDAALAALPVEKPPD